MITSGDVASEQAGPKPRTGGDIPEAQRCPHQRVTVPGTNRPLPGFPVNTVPERRRRPVSPNIPVADGMPLIANLWPMYNNLPRFLVEQYRKHGPVFRVRALNKRYVVLAGPDASSFVGSALGRASLHSRPSWIKLVGEYGADKAVVSDDGELHTQLREMMRRGYSRQSLDGRYMRIVDVIDAWLDEHWPPGTELQAVAQLQELIVNEISIAIADEILFEDIDHIRTQVHWATNVHLLGRWPRVMLRLPKYQRSLNTLMTDAQRITAAFKERAHSPAAQGSNARLFDDLIQANKAHPDLMNDHELPVNIYAPFLAGMDTASNTVAALLYLLLAHPDSHRAVLAESDELFAPNTVIDHQLLLHATPYLNAFIKEAMRMYPTVPILMRHALTDFEFAGYRIPKGEPVMVATVVPQLSAEFFSDPFNFDPTRFLDSENRSHQLPGVYSPWGRGPHTCLGKRIAEILMPLTVARIVHRRHYRLADAHYVLEDRYSYGVDLALNLQLYAESSR